MAISIGICCRKDRAIILRLYPDAGWYCEARLEHDADENGPFSAIRGNWGECDRSWHGTMDQRKIKDIA